jgi:hypothetical protein
LDDIIVNGAGLRYGVCLRELKKTHPHFNFWSILKADKIRRW